MKPARLKGLGLAALLTALAARSWGRLPLPLWSCPLRHLTGVPCPTCYLTRSVMASFQGDLAGAMRLHALGPPLLLAGFWILWQQLVLGREFPAPVVRIAVGIFAGSALLYWLLRLLHPALLPPV